VPRGYNVNWSSVDWTKRNKDIAQELGINSSHVSNMRKEFVPETSVPKRKFKDKTVTLTASVRPEIKVALKKRADLLGMSVSHLVEALLSKSLGYQVLVLYEKIQGKED